MSGGAVRRTRPLALVPLLAVGLAHAEEDVPGAADPGGIARYPGAWIIAHAPATAQRSYEFITGEVARVRREVRIDDSARMAARLERATYRTPNGTRLDDVVAHYEDAVENLGGRVEFACRGRECGRSTIWANQIFRVRELAAPDTAQFYLAATVDGAKVGADSGRTAMVSIYVVQRPNRRVNAHVDLALAEAGAGQGDIARALAQRGFAVIDGAAPDGDGELDAGDLETLDALAPDLAPYAGRLAVVCHLGGSDNPAASLARSEACAQAAANRLEAAGVQTAAFGAGSFVPRDGAAPARLELVVPGTTPAP